MKDITTLSRETLKDLYITKRLSTWKIERLTKRGRSYVYSQLQRLKIPIRTLAESHRQYARKPFDGNSSFKAYLTGFAIGDLRVRRCGGSRSESIGIACSSNKPAQIELIQKLFAPYGRVWVGKPNYRNIVSIEAFVDLSFSFLLPQERDYRWVFATQRNFFSFLAGFTDAEGSIFISANQARVAWGNYNSKLLREIQRKLCTRGIQTGMIVCDNLQGYRGKDGYRRKSNYYHLTCNRKLFVWQLLNFLQPLLRHSDKRAMLVHALKNIKTRNERFGFINMHP